MKSLIFSDLHLSSYSKWGYNDKEKLTRRLVEQRDILNQILQKASDERVDRILFGGDFFHLDKGIETECLNVAKSFFDSLKAYNIPIFAIRGNHDLSLKENGSYYHYSLNPFLDDVKKFKDIYFGHYDEVHDVSKIKGYDIVLIHQTPVGCKLHSHVFNEGVDWRPLAKSNKLVLFGHIHQRQELANNCWVMGPPMHLDFGDKDERGVMIVEGENWEFHPLKYPHFMTLDSATDEGKRSPDHYFRITGADKNSISENEVYVKKPTFFESRVKSTNLVDILNEWLQIQGKSSSYLSVIEDLIDGDRVKQLDIPDLILQNIEIDNFLSFERASLRVETGLNLVEGIGGDFSSNGTGKSTLFEAIFWCLFGETTKGLTGDEVIRKYPKLQKDCEVALTIFDINKSVSYTISRRRKGGLRILEEESDGWKELNEGMKLKESQEYLERFLGFDKTTFCASSYFSQDQVLLLTKLGVADKNSMITELLGFDQYDSLSEEVTSKIAERTEILLKYKDDEYKWVTRNQWLHDSIKTSTAKAAEMIKRAEETKEEGIKIKLEILNIEKEFVQSEYPTVDTSEFDKEEKEITYQIEVAENDLVKKRKQLKQLDRGSVISEISEIKTQISTIDRDAKRYLSEIKTLEGFEDKQCSHCGMVMTEDHRKKYITKLEEQCKECEQSKVHLNLKLQFGSDKFKELETQEKSIEEEIEQLAAIKDDCNFLLKDLSKRRQQALTIVTDREQKEAKRLSLKEKLSIYKQGFDQLKVDFEEIKAQVEKEQAELDHNRIVIQSAAETTAAVNEQVKQLTFWREAFSFKGVRSLLLDNFCNSFNEILSEVMMEVSNGVINVEFSPTSVIKSGESRNKLDLLIYMGGNLQSYESLSGGERKRVDIGVALTFAKWVRKQFSLSSSLLGILIFDELLESLDQHARECILPLLKAEGEDKSVFIINHSNDLGAYADRTIQIRKRNRISELV